MLLFILNNINYFETNPQFFFLIDKIIYLYKNDVSYQNKGNDNIINETIYFFLTSFFDKRISFLINLDKSFSYIIIRLVIKLGYPKNNFIYLEIEKNFNLYAYKKNECLLIQYLFPLGNEFQQQKLFNIILDQCKQLIVDKYGHYLLKYLLYQIENGEKYYDKIFNKIITDVKGYINNKYSSVVIERLLDSSNLYIKSTIIEKLCGNEDDIMQLINHSYGNYVLQKIISVTKDNRILDIIYKTIKNNKSIIYKLSYGKKLIREISKAYTPK